MDSATAMHKFDDFLNQESVDYETLDKDEKKAIFETIHAMMVYMADRVVQKVAARDSVDPVVKKSDVSRYSANLTD